VSRIVSRGHHRSPASRPKRWDRAPAGPIRRAAARRSAAGGTRWVRLLVVMALVLSSCGAAAEAGTLNVSGVGSTEESTAIEARVANTSIAVDVEGVPADASYIGRPANNLVTVRDAPGGQVVHELEQVDDRGVKTAVAILGEPGETWTEVQLAIRPNFTKGWVRTDELDITWTTLRIVISLGEQRLTLLDGDDEVIRGTVAIGNASTPTPMGATFVSELLASSEPDGLYGPFALGLALFSETVTEYAGGNGQVGIHGTNRPDLLGKAVSLGCVRVSNDLISELAGRVPLGTPVEIVV